MDDQVLLTYESTNTMNVYSYVSFPNVVFDICINGTQKSFTVSESDMGTIIKSLKNIINATFNDQTSNQIIITDDVIDENDIHDDIKRLSKSIEETFNSLFDDIVKVITKQCHTIGERYEVRILDHTIHWFQNLCTFVQDAIMANYSDLRMMDKTFISIVNDIYYDKQSLPTDAFIAYKKKKGINIIKTRSFQPTKYTEVLYKDKVNNLKIAKSPIKPSHYIINVKKNLCSCPDFIHRKLQAGLSCKHLLELKNKTRCLMLLAEIQNTNLYNVNMPFKAMLNTAYDTVIQY